MRTTPVFLIALFFVLTAAPELSWGGVADDGSTSVRDGADQRTFQKPRLSSGLGSVDFAISVKSALAQIYFDQGMLMLYQRDERQAERAFLQIIASDPDCAMAHWGLAMANRGWPDVASLHIEKAIELGKAGKLSDRERFVISRFVVERQKKLETNESTSQRKPFKINRRLRDDAEVQALLLWHMLEETKHGQADVDWTVARSLLRTVLRKNPAHPVQVEWLARFTPDSPEQQLSAAKRACEVMPHAPRAWREAGRVYANAGRYEDAVRCYETAMRLEHERMRADRILPEQVPGHAETQTGLIENLTRLGRIRDALALARRMVTAPCLTAGPWSSRSNTMCVQAQRAVLDLLSRYELWNETIELSQSPVWNAFFPELEVDQQAVLGLAYFFTGDVTRGREQIVRLKTQWLKSLVTLDESPRENAAKTSSTVRERLIARLAGAEPVLRRIESSMNILRVYEAFASNDLPRLRELLDGEPDIPAAQLARLHLAVGNLERAKSLAFDVRPDSRHRILDLANQANVLHQAGDERAARSRLKELRRASAVFDRDLPMIRRVSASLPANPKATDEGRSGLEPFNGLHRHSFTASDLTLPDRHGKLVSLNDYRGRPVLVVFYLGAGCPHCIEQLQSLAPMHEKFVEAGIKVIAVSTDTIDGLQETYEVADIDGEGDKTLPFTLVSDSSLDCFRAFRAFDEFGDIPMHGAFLLDGERRVLWQNTGKKPFMQIGFLLQEAKRLLSYTEANAKPYDRAARVSKSRPAFN